MDILGPYQGTEKGNQYALTVICMLINYIFMIPIRMKRTEEVIKMYLTVVYSTFGGSKYILSNSGSEFTSKEFTFVVNELDFIKVYTSSHTPTDN